MRGRSKARFHFGHRVLVLFPAIDLTAAGSSARERALLPFPCSIFCLAQFSIFFFFFTAQFVAGGVTHHRFIFFQPTLLLASWLLAQVVNQGFRNIEN
jgi:hypothetical protein